MNRLTPGLLAIVSLAGCALAQTPAVPETPAPATYSAVATRVLSNCTTRSCHGEAGRRGNLVLTPERAYEELVNRPAAMAAAAARGKRRVVPGDPDASFLMEKLTAPAPDEGARMPLGNPPLSAEELDLIRRWIAAGAPG